MITLLTLTMHSFRRSNHGGSCSGRGEATAVKTAIKVERNIVHMNKILDVVKIEVAG